MSVDVYKSFNKLINSGNHSEAILLLKDYEKTKCLSVEEKGWIFWNISDRYALMREFNLEYENHIKFFKWGIKNLSPDKLHWIVSDSTQALTLSLGNYFDDWYSWYSYACDHSSKSNTNRKVRFESHRALAYSMLKLNKLSNIQVPFKHLKDLIDENESDPNFIYYTLTYYILLIEKDYKENNYEGIDKSLSKIKHIINSLLDIWAELRDNDTRKVLGSWSDLNCIKSSKKSTLTLFHNLGCTLNRLNYYLESKQIFDYALARGHDLNRYGLALYLSSLWNVSQNKKLVEDKYIKLRQDKNISTKQLIAIDSVLKKVFESV